MTATDIRAAAASRRLLHQGWTVEAIAGPVPAGFPAAVPAVVPGVVHTDLLAAGVIEDPFDGDNESAQQWIGDVTWRYRTSFAWHPDGAERHDLVAEGLDTVATLRLNGVEVARTENQHRSYRFDVRGLLVDGENVLEVDFAAPVPETERRAAEHGRRPRVNHHEFNQLRKAASNFGWDWGIDVATSGIWRPIALESWSGVRIASVRPLVDVVDGEGVLTAHVALEHAAEPVAVRVAVTVDGQTADVVTRDDTAVVVVSVPDVELWWPIGHGAQPRYDVHVAAGEAVWTGRVGFRTVELDTAPDAAGRPFQLRVNGRDLLVRGVNWIPDHAFVTQVDRGRLEQRFADMVDADVNLVRVWGGGIYESEDFYDLADGLGLMVWQDFLFACAAYSEGPDLASEVQAEAREHVTRLSAHPCLVLWNGGNENIWAFADWGWPAALEGRSWGDGYYRELLPSLVAELDPTRPYSPGSPYSFDEYLHPNDPRNGTMHIWDVWNQKDYVHYRDHRPRFVSEFGFQGPPAWSTLTRVVHDEPLDPFGPQMLVHQKADLGNEKLRRGAEPHLPPLSTIDDWHWGMQLNQAHAIRFGVEHFRSLTPHNTGVVLWQLNDDWPVVSWAAVDFDGHRKPLWYAMRSAYAPRLATIQPRSSAQAVQAAFPGVAPQEDVLSLVLVNDTDEAVLDEVLVSRWDVAGTVLAQATLRIEAPARGTATLELPSSVAAFGNRRRELLVAEAVGGSFARALLDAADVVAQDLDPDPVQARVEATEEGFRVRVRATSYARDVMLLVDRFDPGAVVDQGLLSLLPGEEAEFAVTTTAESGEGLLDPLVLRCANDLLRAHVG